MISYDFPATHQALIASKLPRPSRPMTLASSPWDARASARQESWRPVYRTVDGGGDRRCLKAW